MKKRLISLLTAADRIILVMIPVVTLKLIMLAGSDSEQEIVLLNKEEKEAGSGECERGDTKLHFIGKNGTKWFRVPEMSNMSTRSKNIIRERQGIKDIGKNAKRGVECWKLFFTEDILQEIGIHTNSQI